MEFYDRKTYTTLTQIYKDHFTLNDFKLNAQEKMALVFLVCYLTDKMKAKKPDTSCWTVLYTLNKDIHLPDNVLMGLAIVCEDFFRGGGEFPTFGLENKSIIPKLKGFLQSYLPF